MIPASPWFATETRWPGPCRSAGAYLLPSENRDAINYTPDSSRRARAIEVWAALKSMGRSGLADLVGRNCRQARHLAEGLRKAGVEILNDVVLNQVVAAFDDDERTSRGHLLGAAIG